MFSDPFAAVMALIILNFAGVLLMFVFGLRSFDAQQKTLKEIRNQISIDAADLDQRLREIEYALRKITPAQGAEAHEDLGTLLDKAAATGNLAAFAAAPASFAATAATLPYTTGEPQGASPLANAAHPDVPRVFPLEENDTPATGNTPGTSAETWSPEHPLSLK